MFEETTDTWYPMLSSGGSGSAPEGVAPYTGPYSVTPKASVTQILPTASKYMKNNVMVTVIGQGITRLLGRINLCLKP